VLSFRPVRLRDAYGVNEHRFGPAGTDRIRHDLTFDDFVSAAMYRSMLIAERSHHGDMFWDGFSAGARHEIDFFRNENTPLKVWRIDGQ